MGYLIPVTTQAFVNRISTFISYQYQINNVPIIYRFHYCNSHFYTTSNLDYAKRDYNLLNSNNNTLLLAIKYQPQIITHDSKESKFPTPKC